MNRKVKLDCLQPLREEGDPIIIFAAVREAEAIYYACRDMGIVVTAFCDSEGRKSVSPFCGLEVIHTPTLPKRFPKARFLLATQHIIDVADQLTEMGYSEFYSALELLNNFDLNKHEYLTSQPYMQARVSVYKKSHEAYFDESVTYMRSIDVMVTTRCTLKCESCSNLMQYYENPKDTDFERTIRALDVLNENVDDISEVRLIGGEPLFNKDWARICKSITDKKPEQKIFVYTNGTIAPKDEQLELIQGKQVHFIITTYGPLSRNVDRLVEKLEQRHIAYDRKPAEDWLDCSSIKHHKRAPSDNKEVFKQCCVKYIYTLLDGRLYRCPFIANAANLKALPDNPANYVDLLSENPNMKQQIRRLVNERNFFPGCDFCDGRPYDPATKIGYNGKGMISPGIQAPKPIKYVTYP